MSLSKEQADAAARAMTMSAESRPSPSGWVRWRKLWMLYATGGAVGWSIGALMDYVAFGHPLIFNLAGLAAGGIVVWHLHRRQA